MSGGTVGDVGVPRRRGPAPWVVVLLTLMAVAVVLGAFGAGVGLGLWAAGRAGAGAAAPGPGTPVPAAPAPAPAPAPTGPATQPPGQPPEPTGPGTPAPTVTGALDPCLVGSWRSTEHEESYDTEQGRASLTGLERTMTFAADGTQTVAYDGSRATVTTDQGALPAVFDGQVVYRATTEGSTMSFEVLSTDGAVTVLGPDGEVAEERPLEPGTGDVAYTCDDRRLVQEATGYRSVYERTG